MHVDAIQLTSHDEICGQYCIPSFLSDSKQNPTSDVCDSFDFGTSLQDVYPLLRSIFKHLRYADLKSAEKVNEVWGRYAREELALRNGASWLCLTKLKKGDYLLEKTHNFTYDDVSFCLVFYQYKHVKLGKFICLHGAEKCTRMPFVEYLTREIVPEAQEYWTFSCSNVNRINSVAPVKSKSLFSALLIPRMRHIVTRRFCISTKEFKLCDIGKALEKHLEPDEVVDCLLVFTVSYLNDFVENLLQEITAKQATDTVALCGGVIPSGIQMFNHPNARQCYSSHEIYCIAFNRKRGATAEFGAFSVVMEQKDDFERKLAEFRNKTVLRKNSFLIKIVCSAKIRSQAETSIVYKYFPTTSVISLDASGEIGWDKFACEEERAEDDLPKKKSKLAPRACHAYSTVLVLITWGPKLQSRVT